MKKIFILPLASPCLEHVREMALMTPDLRGLYNFSRLTKAARMYHSPPAGKNRLYGSCKIFFSFLFLEGFEVGLEGSEVQTEDQNFTKIILTHYSSLKVDFKSPRKIKLGEVRLK
jgi:hypothetical protein